MLVLCTGWRHQSELPADLREALATAKPLEPLTGCRTREHGPFGRQRQLRPARCAGVQDEPTAADPYGTGPLRRALRFRIETVLAPRLGVAPRSAAPVPAPSGGTGRCDGRCRLVGCRHG
jgi:hypothetical protein